MFFHLLHFHQPSSASSIPLSLAVFVAFGASALRSYPPASAFLRLHSLSSAWPSSWWSWSWHVCAFPCATTIVNGAWQSQAYAWMTQALGAAAEPQAYFRGCLSKRKKLWNSPKISIRIYRDRTYRKFKKQKMRFTNIGSAVPTVRIPVNCICFRWISLCWYL